MAKPDLDNGHFIQLSHEILERLMQCNLSAKEFRVVLYVLRMTYGFKRKEAPISSYELSEHLESDPSDVRKVVGSLCQRLIIRRVADRKGTRPPVYSFCKDWETWGHGRKTGFPDLVACRGKITPTNSRVQGENHPYKRGQNPPTKGVEIPLQAGSKSPYNAAEVSEQTDTSPTLIKNKEQTNKNPPTPQGGTGGVEDVLSDLRARVKRAMRANGWEPSRKELNKSVELVESVVPIGWDKSAWRKHVFRALMTTCNEVKAEMLAGTKIYAPIALACERLRNQIAIDAMLPPRKEAI